MQQYLDLVKDILEDGEATDDRTGTGTISVFTRSERYDLTDGKIPLLTTRKLNFNTILTELLWFIKGSGNCDYLDEHKVKIWKLWTEPMTNSIGPLYPVQLRRWEETAVWYDNPDKKEEGWEEQFRFTTLEEDGPDVVVYKKHHDQLRNLIEKLKVNPRSRRHVISYWNVPFLPDESIDPIDNVRQGKMALPPCHVLLQFHVNTKDELSCHLYMRSSDVLVGRPFNICQYSILTHMIAKLCGYKAKEFIITSGDTHIYNDHIENAKELITREPYQSPTLVINPNVKDIDDYTKSDFSLVNYQAYAPMKFNVSK